MITLIGQEISILTVMGDTKGAIEAAKKSMAVAEAAGNADYVKMNKDSLKEWGAFVFFNGVDLTRKSHCSSTKSLVRKIRNKISL
mgnify:CR=1 FL=1